MKMLRQKIALNKRASSRVENEHFINLEAHLYKQNHMRTQYRPEIYKCKEMPILLVVGTIKVFVAKVSIRTEPSILSLLLLIYKQKRFFLKNKYQIGLKCMP